VLHLPVIVESAESSPQAAAAAALQIRKYLSKENYTRPQFQYNAIMLIRILTDNPGPSFTKNLDSKFAQTMKELLRNSRDQSVQQIARETLSALYQEKAYDTNLATLFAMWTKEVPNQPRPQAGVMPGPRTMNAPAFGTQQMPMGFGAAQQTPDHFARHRGSHTHGIPPPAELAARIEEAKTSAKLLQQLVQSTPPAELQGNDLIKEFGQRVSAAQKSIQGYINCDDPPPDEDTLQTLIETSEQLSLAASKHQRAVLQARRLVGPATPPIAAPARGDVPILSAPALPARTGSNGLPIQQPRPQHPTSPRDEGTDTVATGTTTAATTYLPPSGPPPNQRTAPEEDEDDTLYNPPPAPPAALQANLQRRAVPNRPPTSLDSSVDRDTVPALPPMAINREPIEMPAARHTPPTNPSDDPFSDHYASAAAANANEPRPAVKEPESASSLYDSGAEGPPTDGERGSPASYKPGYQSTPSYLHRQASSGDKLVMTGGRSTPERNERRAEGESQASVSPLYERTPKGGAESRERYRY
jgi:hypothetical protein